MTPRVDLQLTSNSLQERILYTSSYMIRWIVILLPLQNCTICFPRFFPVCVYIYKPNHKGGYALYNIHSYYACTVNNFAVYIETIHEPMAILHPHLYYTRHFVKRTMIQSLNSIKGR